MTKQIISLLDLESHDHPFAGGKPIQLKTLLDLGMPIPDTLVLTDNLFFGVLSVIDGFREALDQLITHEDCESVLEKIRNMILLHEFSDSHEEAFRDSLVEFGFPGNCHLVLRPSPFLRKDPEEEIPIYASSILNIRTHRDFLRALRLVWASFWNLRAFEFRRQNYVPEESVGMAVLVQKMVQSEYSGICKSSAAYRKDLVEIQTAWGMPEGVRRKIVPNDTITMALEQDASGGFLLKTVDEKVANKSKKVSYRGMDEVVEDVPREDALKILPDVSSRNTIAMMARRLESHLGKTITITWGYQKKIYLLGVDYDSEESPKGPTWKLSWYSALAGETASPVGTSILSNFIETDMRNLAGIADVDYEIIKKSILTRELLGRLYFNYDFLRTIAEDSRFPSGVLGDILSLYVVDPEEGIKKDSPSFRISLSETMSVNRFFEQTLEVFSGNLEESRSFQSDMKLFPYEKADRKTLGVAFSRANSLAADLGTFATVPASILMCVALLHSVTKGGKKQNLFRVVPGVCFGLYRSYHNSIIKLHRLFQESPEVMSSLSDFQVDTSRLAALRDSEFVRVLVEFLREFVYLSEFPLDPQTPRFLEDPSMILSLLGHLNRKELSEYFTSSRCEEMHEKELESVSGSPLEFLQKVFRSGSLNQSSLKKNLVALMDLASQLRRELCMNMWVQRRILLQLGQLMYQAEKLDSPEDIFLLDRNEVQIGADTQYVDYTAMIRERKKYDDSWKKYRAPGVFSGSGLVINHREPVRPSSGSFSRKGVPIVSGTVRGKVLKIRSYRDFARSRPDHIPLLRYLSVPMVPFLLNMPAVILETLDFSCTDIALLRRLGIPSVGGFPGIMSTISEDASVVLEGDTGLLQLDL